jgi:hypothetical protein
MEIPMTIWTLLNRGVRYLLGIQDRIPEPATNTDTSIPRGHRWESSRIPDDITIVKSVMHTHPDRIYLGWSNRWAQRQDTMQVYPVELTPDMVCFYRKSDRVLLLVDIFRGTPQWVAKVLDVYAQKNEPDLTCLVQPLGDFYMVRLFDLYNRDFYEPLDQTGIAYIVSEMNFDITYSNDVQDIARRAYMDHTEAQDEVQTLLSRGDS